MNNVAYSQLTGCIIRLIFHFDEYYRAGNMKPQELGQALRGRRKLAKVTQSDLADLSGLSVHTLSDLESGKGNPTLAVLTKVCEVLGLEIQLAPRNPSPPSSPQSVEGEIQP